jgi:hypothetical protein
MTTSLDRMLFTLVEVVDTWETLLTPEDVDLVKQRLAGAKLGELSEAAHLSVPGVRARLYGTGFGGGRRRGGALGRLRVAQRRATRGR